MKVPTEPGAYILCTIIDGTQTLSLAKVKSNGFVWHLYLCERLPETAVFVRIPDGVVEEAEAEARAKFVALQISDLKGKSSWEQESQLKGLKIRDASLFLLVWAALPPETQENLKRYMDMDL